MREIKKYAVSQLYKGKRTYTENDIFDTKREALDYMRDCYEPEHKARVEIITQPIGNNL